MIDWILAERIAGYVAGPGENGAPTSNLPALAAETERRVTAYTGLTPAQPLPQPEGMTRKEWVASNVGAMQPLLDPVLERAGEGLGPLRPAVQIGFGVVLTTEVGVVLGYLAQRVLGQYELVLLDAAENGRPPRLLFVLPNLGQAVHAFGAEEQEFMTWVALHEVTHAVQFASVPWLQRPRRRPRARAAATAPSCGSTRRASCGCRRGEEIRRTVAALRQGDLISIVTSEAERETLDRVQAVMAVIEGHAEHVMDAVAPDLLPSLPKLRAALDQRRRSQSGLSRLLARLLGLDLKLKQYEQGKFFCDAVVREGGPEALHRVFSGPEALPTLAELRDPAAWLAADDPARAAAAPRSADAAPPGGLCAAPRAGSLAICAPSGYGRVTAVARLVYKHMFGVILTPHRLRSNILSPTGAEQAKHGYQQQQSQRAQARHTRKRRRQRVRVSRRHGLDDHFDAAADPGRAGPGDRRARGPGSRRREPASPATTSSRPSRDSRPSTAPAGVERELKRYERRGATARNRLERQVRRTRTKFERELRQRRTRVERTVKQNRRRLEREVRPVRKDLEKQSRL